MVSYKQLTDYAIHATDGDIGGCKDILFDDQDFITRYLVADTNTWLPMSRKVVISPISIDSLNADEEKVYISMTSDALKHSPSIDQHKPVSRDYEETLFQYFGYGYYWIGPGAWGDFAHPTELANVNLDEQVNDGEPAQQNHLRSCDEVHGYEVATTDGDSGHITDFLIDPASWAVKALVVDTHNWLPGGKKLLILPTQIARFDWSSHKVFVTLSQEALEQQPEIDLGKLHDDSYVTSLIGKAG